MSPWCGTRKEPTVALHFVSQKLRLVVNYSVDFFFLITGPTQTRWIFNTNQCKAALRSQGCSTEQIKGGFVCQAVTAMGHS